LIHACEFGMEAARHARHDRDQVRLRPGAVRRLHRACRRRGDALFTRRPHHYGKPRSVSVRCRRVWSEDDDLKAKSAETPIVVFAHIPLWTVYEQWGWGTDDGARAIELLRSTR